MTDELSAAMVAARKRGLQQDLRNLAARIRADAADMPASPDFHAGVDWTLLWIENTATSLTADLAAEDPPHDR
ncbi:hypothetical protein ACGRHY_29295 [Streptomyces sp. HK10]|uniref:hypothetical protein n=1 Tax=Streptomyces sp. HK10 TaxID=3373255 RepID=UPI003748C03F